MTAMTFQHALLTCLLVGCAAGPRVSLGDDSAPDAGRDAEGAEEDESAEDKLREHECTEDEPVCGSDNMVYRNRCLATDAGVLVVKRGPC